MNEQRIEALLERIAVALERLAGDRDAREGFVAEQAPQTACASADEVRIDAASDTAPSRPSVLETFLHSRGIRIKTVPPDDAADAMIDSLSLYLGERYDALSSLLAKIKRAMQSGMPITESLKNRSQQDISSNCQFCTRLHEVAFLEQYQYFRSPTYLIKAKTTTLPRAQRFLLGSGLRGSFSRKSSRFTHKLRQR